MKFISYIQYFLYLASHWDPLFALFVIYYEFKGESKYHINTIGVDDLKSLKDEGIDISHATKYMPVNYYVLERLMKEIVKYSNNKTFLDIGCGKGRALVTAASFGFEQITGIDFSKEFCKDALATTNLYSQKNPSVHYTIINMDAFNYDIPNDITTLFIFNPFDDVIMSRVIANILISQQNYPRTIRVMYANPVHKSLFLEKGFVEIYHVKKLEYLEGIILQLEAEKN